VNGHDLLHHLDDLGVELTLSGGRVRYRGPDDALTPELLGEMKEHRDDLTTLVARRAALRWPPERHRDVGPRRGGLTRAQRDMWATSHYHDDGTYNVSGALRLRGGLDRTALRSALSDLLARHPSLRTVFRSEHGEPVQEVLATVHPPLADVDLSDRPDALGECLRDCARRADRILPLDTAPPVRIVHYRLGPRDHVLFVLLHHIIADAVSVVILLDDLGRCYNTRIAGGAPDTAPGGLDMIDYASWEHEQRAVADRAVARRYWRDQMSGADLGPLPLPPPADPSGDRGGALTAIVDPATTGAVRSLATASRSSPYVVVCAAIAVALSRTTGRHDLVIGMPVARRDQDGLDRLVGLLLDTVPVRVVVPVTATFERFVRDLRVGVLGALAHAPTPPDVLADADRTPFNVVIADAGGRLVPHLFTGLSAEELPVDRVGAKFDLNFLIRDDDATLAIDVEFDRRTIAATDLSAVLDRVLAILADGTASPARAVAGLAATPFGVAAPAAAGVPADRVPADGDTLPGRLAAVAARRGDAVAVSCAGGQRGYRDLHARAAAIARGLVGRGIGTGDVVAVSLPRGLDLVEAIIGVMASGAAVLVLDDAWPAARREWITADAASRLTVGDMPGPGVATPAELMSAVPHLDPEPARPGVAYVIYTSGSTGRPKGVHVTHRNLLSLVDGTAGGFGFGPADVWTLFHSCAFDVSMFEMFGCLLSGGRLVVVPGEVTREPAEFAALLGRERVTVLSQTPSALSVMLPALAAEPVADLRYVLLAGEALDRWLADQWYGAFGDRTQLVNLYGTTETTVHATWAWLRPGDTWAAESDVGVPLPGGTLHVLDAAGRSVADRCVGEICVGGPQVSLGYLGRPRETALRFVPDPFADVPGARLYRSGDLGRRNGDRVASLGRRDAQVKVSGFRIELAEIEAALARQPGVAAAAAAVRRDGAGPAIVAVVVPDGELSAPAVLRGVRATLPRYMVPHALAITDRLPLTVNGKLDVAAVVDACLASPPTAADGAPPQGPVETGLAELYAEVLGVSPVSGAADFFELGGDSMRAVQLVGLAHDRGLVLTVRDVYLAPTLSDLARRAEVGDTGDTGHVGREPFSVLGPELSGTFADDVVDAYPMTALQSGMIYHQEIAPDSGSYHIVLSYRVRGRLRPAAFRAAVHTVTETHPVLRTSFDVAHPVLPVQRVHRTVDPPLSFEDLRHLDPSDAAERVRRAKAAETATGFDLARPPLWRLVVLTLTDDEYQVVFTHHHAILDGWSVNVFFEDLQAEYRARFDGGQQGRLAAPDGRFADYVALERQALSDPAQAEFWAGRTRRDAPLVAPDRADQPVMRQVHVSFPGLIDDLRAAAVGAGVPLKTLLLASHVRVVSWLTGADLVATSLVYACRPETPKAEQLLGLFLNQLPLHVALARQSWRELARHLHHEELEMMPRRWYPSAAIQRQHGTRPIFDSSFNFTDYHTTRRLIRDGLIDVLDSDEIESTHYAFGSNFTVDLRTGELRLILEYDAAALPESTVALAGEAHRRVLSAIVADPLAGNRDTVLPGAADLARLLSTSVAASGPTMPAVPAAPATPAPAPELEPEVQAVWTAVLGPGDYPADLSFFTVGGSSLTAMQVVSRLRKHHGALSMRDFLAAPTIAGLAAALAAARTTGPAASVDTVEGAVNRYPTTPAQRQMWLVSRRLPGVPLFGMPGALLVRGPLDTDRLTRTLAALTRRHQALRTRIDVTADDEPELVVEPHVEVTLPTVDLSGEPDPDAACERRLAAIVREPIDLGRAPLMRAVVYRLAADRHVVYLDVHHLVCDGWSMALLLREAAETYAAPDAAAARPPAAGHGELLRARVGWTGSPDADRQRAYWRDRLAPPWPDLADPPGSRFRELSEAPFVQRLRSASVVRRLNRSAVALLRHGAARHGLTEFMVLLSGLAATLRAWSGEPDVRVATQLANRTDPELESLIGLAVNTVVLRLSVPDRPDPLALARQVRQVCLDAYANQELPFEDILAEWEPTAAGPLYRVMLVMQQETPTLWLDGSPTFSAYRPDRDVLNSGIAATTADFLLGVTPIDGELALTVRYQPATTDFRFATELLSDVASAVTAIAEALQPRSEGSP
jgi:amino acid adenylation domain-containing protein